MVRDGEPFAGYTVVCEDGPAAGFSYQTGIEPDETIVVVPNEPAVAGSFGAWRRGLLEGAPWPGQVLYRRGAIQPLTAMQQRFGGEVTIYYRKVA